MKSEWKVTQNYIGRTVYGVYRLKDINAIDHSGNRELAGGYVDSREEAQQLADKLNKEMKI